MLQPLAAAAHLPPLFTGVKTADEPVFVTRDKKKVLMFSLPQREPCPTSLLLFMTRFQPWVKPLCCELIGLITTAIHHRTPRSHRRRSRGTEPRYDTEEASFPPQPRLLHVHLGENSSHCGREARGHSGSLKPPPTHHVKNKTHH